MTFLTQLPKFFLWTLFQNQYKKIINEDTCPIQKQKSYYANHTHLQFQ